VSSAGVGSAASPLVGAGIGLDRDPVSWGDLRHDDEPLAFADHVLDIGVDMSWCDSELVWLASHGLVLVSVISICSTHPRSTHSHANTAVLVIWLERLSDVIQSFVDFT
jgi:hypothetical protein